MGQHEKRRASISGTSPVDEGTSRNDGPTCLEPFSHQVGGHVSVLRWDDRTVCKPYSTREHQFYERTLASKTLIDFVPAFKGVIEVGLVEDSAGYLSLTALSSTVANNASSGRSQEQKLLSRSSRTTKIKLKRSGSLELECCGQVEEVFQDVGTSTYPQNPWAIRCQTSHIAKMRRKNKERHQFLLLQNLVYKYRYPCILDLKMGTQQHGDDASEAKRLAQVAKCQRSTSAYLGTRMCGMQVYQRRSGVFKCHNKYYGRALSVEGFKAEIRSFLHNGETFRADLIDLFLAKLQALLHILQNADGYRFFSSSLLLIYDGAEQEEYEDALPHADVRMIDFEHSTFRGFGNDPEHEGPDLGYIFGVKSIIGILSEIRLNPIDPTTAPTAVVSREGSGSNLAAFMNVVEKNQDAFLYDSSGSSTCCCSTDALTTDDSISERT